MTLTEFLAARLDEDEADARDALDARPTITVYDDAHEEMMHLASNEGARDAAVDFVARHAPARVLAELEAKRRIVEEWERERANAHARVRHGGHPGYAGPILERGLRLLAVPYADHPDYDEAWRP